MLLAQGFVAAVLAPRCAACDEALARPLDGPVCGDCWRSIARFTPPLCTRCGDPLRSWRHLDTTGACPRCLARSSPISTTVAIGAYDGALRSILHALKYSGCRSLAPRLAELLREDARQVLDRGDVVVPVPLHRRRERARGFNQARELAAGLGLPVRDILRRTRATASQVDLPAEARHENVRQAFGLARGVDHLAGVRIVLVDDVSTTGATLEACAEVLLGAGAVEVSAVTAARVVTQPHA